MIFPDERARLRRLPLAAWPHKPYGYHLCDHDREKEPASIHGKRLGRTLPLSSAETP